MKKKTAFLTVLITVLSLMLPAVSANSGEYDEVKSIRVGYCQGEDYYEFDYALNYLILALEERGLIGSLQGALTPDSPSRVTWDLLKQYDQSGWTVQFSQDAYFSLTDSSYSELSEDETGEIMRGVTWEDNVSVIIACGTIGSRTAKQLSDECGIISLAAADPLESQIVNAEDTSQTNNVWAVIDTEAFNRSIMVMNDIFQPATVGVVYADDDEAYIYSGVYELDKFARDNHLTVIRRYVDDPQYTETGEDVPRYYQEISKAYEQLAKEVDVFVMTSSLINMEDMRQLFTPFYEQNTPIFSINSAEEVKYGALMAVEISDYKNIGRFAADTISEYLSGAALSDLPQVYQTAPFLVLNYSTAKRIGYKPDFQMLLVASEIYVE